VTNLLLKIKVASHFAYTSKRIAQPRVAERTAEEDLKNVEYPNALPQLTNTFAIIVHRLSFCDLKKPAFSFS